MSYLNRKPIEYVDFVDVRFADLDFYGHVNSKHYLDFVSTTRLNYLANEMNLPVHDVAKRGVGFFLSKSTIYYRRPINGLQKLLVTSHVGEIRDERTLVIPFAIKSKDGIKTFSDGVLEFTVVDLSTKRAAPAPAWVTDLFFEVSK